MDDLVGAGLQVAGDDFWGWARGRMGTLTISCSDATGRPASQHAREARVGQTARPTRGPCSHLFLFFSADDEERLLVLAVGGEGKLFSYMFSLDVVDTLEVSKKDNCNT